MPHVLEGLESAFVCVCVCSKGAKEAGDELQKEDPEAMQLEIIHQERKVVDILEKCHALSWE